MCNYKLLDKGFDPRLIFVLMPFNEPWSDDLWVILKDAGRMSKLKINRVDKVEYLSPNRFIIDDIRQLIGISGLIVAEITTRNANVFYELGIAHTLHKDVLLIRKMGAETPPFDILGMPYIEYELNSGEDKEMIFKKRLSNLFKKNYIDNYSQWVDSEL